MTKYTYERWCNGYKSNSVYFLFLINQIDLLLLQQNVARNSFNICQSAHNQNNPQKQIDQLLFSLHWKIKLPTINKNIKM